MYKKSLLFSLALSTTLSLQSAEKKSFVIPPKPIKESTNTLKEQVGESLQKTLKRITSLQKQTALLQQKLSETQHQLLKAGSTVLKNKETFKKATKESLVQAQTTINALHTNFDEGSRMITIILKQTEKNTLTPHTCFTLEKETHKKT